MRRPHWRVLTWIILAFNVLMLVWLIGGLASVASDADCAEETTKALRNACEAGTAVGATIGAGIIVFLWVAGDVIPGSHLAGDWTKEDRHTAHRVGVRKEEV